MNGTVQVEQRLNLIGVRMPFSELSCAIGNSDGTGDHDWRDPTLDFAP